MRYLVILVQDLTKIDMRRIFKMTEKAKNATKTRLSNGDNQLPTKWLVDGDAKEGYKVSAVNDDLCGFDFISLQSLYAVKMFINQVNETGTTDFKKHCTVGSFAWAEHAF